MGYVFQSEDLNSMTLDKESAEKFKENSELRVFRDLHGSVEVYINAFGCVLINSVNVTEYNF